MWRTRILVNLPDKILRRNLAFKSAVVLLVFVVCCVLAGLSQEDVFAWQPPQQAQEEFLPIDELPPEDQLPAAAFLVAAYAIAWVLLLLYLWFIWQRLNAVERELADVARRMGERS